MTVYLKGELRMTKSFSALPGKSVTNNNKTGDQFSINHLEKFPRHLPGDTKKATG